ncbi:VOC family protein [Nocardioides agariphilus]|jgi:catechol 2,3-dioxygenase-like lactoylglutathione lyase family enzyme|uniref:VOC family protein n=1 Tax=Nocardioides agariphilus TaxID=433664 RepID=A0A930VLB7_9ACTN|nr:VOC family protein [Nocardioides agariphilus]MBF4767716.1 VOC family protein [Nocardioides agariphilus]
MDVDLFVGLPVSDLPRALAWYPLLLGDLESFDPNDTERVWTLAEHRYVYAVLEPERAGGAIVTLFVDDLGSFVEAAAARGIEPTQRETYDNGVRKVTYHDPDGNEIGVGGGPQHRSACPNH